MSDNGLLHSQTHIPRGPSGSVSSGVDGTGGGTMGVRVGATYKEIAAYYISLHMHAVCMHTFSVLLWRQRFFGKEDIEVIIGAHHPKKHYLANCPAASSIR